MRADKPGPGGGGSRAPERIAVISLVLYLLMTLSAALWMVDHVALAARARRRGSPWALSLALPAWASWQAGEHGAAVRYGLWAGMYVAFSVTARVLATR